MDSLDIAVLRSLLDWRAAGRHAALATVVHTWGSSPRPVGSTMVVCDDGSVVGSVSGGCIEDDLLARYDPHARLAAADALRPGPPQWLRYGLSADEAHRFGLPCGGTLELLLEHDPAAASLSALIDAVSDGRLVQRRVALADGAVTLRELAAPQALTCTADALTHTYGPAQRMLLIGAGPLAQYLATMALFNGYAVTVCDPRVEYSATWNVPGVTWCREMPDDAVAAFRPDARSCVIALTHDPKLDDLALLEALASKAFYVGAIGSQRSNAARRERLRDHFGISAEQLQRLHGPVGLPIGSRTPAEIAVSVMAHLIASMNQQATDAPRSVGRGAAACAAACASRRD